MSTIPNVSSVYRDLAHIYTNTEFITKNNQPVNYLLDHNQYHTNQQTSFEQLYTYKQKRHNELMSRLHNSVQQNKIFLGGFSQTTYNSESNLNSQKNKRQYQIQPFSYSCVNRLGSSSASQVQKIGNFIMPKIKYRHIEDKTDQKYKNCQMQIIQKSPIKQSSNFQLHKQFYEDMHASGKTGSKKLLKSQKYQGNQQQKGKVSADQDIGSQISNRTNAFVRTNKNQKYQDKIQSYYELCRKNISTKNISVQSNKQERFIRTSNKNKAMKLDEAIKLLSID